MLVYRIVHKKYSDTLFASGLAGRWNSTGKKVLYTSESVSLAYLENMAHRNGLGFNNDFRIMVIEIPSKVSFYEVKPYDLPKNWRSFRNYEECQKIGDKWFHQCEFLYMKVPSAIVSENCNIVINTLHKDYKKVKLLEVLNFYPDDRLEELIKR
ncbi:RES family NAD+ phosphorylase [Parapusillimonas sp. SGNA-6]|uniref:RES family NAD+ phosphorylase n=1 Tax=Parapedobacter sp. SGR-10 TaxID=2710879 RepID=UPI0013D25A21|nr:RES family NAD+ phosphorylase [Parapedobacter sp. SGR-10]NGF56218.1 RES family NAD+ phosphorylase [Parapedobacter sp. SGR-10]NGM90856.1 RES family NAD+ phosphorylase [Parapusillimonas sp. SGNA-6]